MNALNFNGLIYGLDVSLVTERFGGRTERVAVSLGMLALCDHDNPLAMYLRAGALALDLLNLEQSGSAVAQGATMTAVGGQSFVILDGSMFEQQGAKLILTRQEWFITIRHAGQVRFYIDAPPQGPAREELN